MFAIGIRQYVLNKNSVVPFHASFKHLSCERYSFSPMPRVSHIDRDIDAGHMIKNYAKHVVMLSHIGERVLQRRCESAGIPRCS